MAQLVVAAAGMAIGGLGFSGAILTAAGTLTAGASYGFLAGSLAGETSLATGRNTQAAANLDQEPHPHDDTQRLS